MPSAGSLAKAQTCVPLTSTMYAHLFLIFSEIYK